MVGKICARKANQSAKPGNGTVKGYCMHVAITVAGPLKWNRPSMTIWLVFQNLVTNDLYMLAVIFIIKHFTMSHLHTRPHHLPPITYPLLRYFSNVL